MYSTARQEQTSATIAATVEAGHARTRFRVIMKTFSTRYTTIIGNRIIHPSYIWNRILVQFAAAVVCYLKKKNTIVPKSEGVTIKKLSLAVESHLQSDYPHLVIPFRRELKLNPTALTWDGPAIEIIQRTEAFDKVMLATGLEEGRELPERPLYVGGDDSYYQEEWSSDESDDGESEV